MLCTQETTSQPNQQKSSDEGPSGNKFREKLANLAEMVFLVVFLDLGVNIGFSTEVHSARKYVCVRWGSSV